MRRTCRANLYFPQSFAAGSGSGRLPAGCSKKNILVLPVVVTSEELLLLCMEQPDYITLPSHTKTHKHIHAQCVTDKTDHFYCIAYFVVSVFVFI